MARRSWKESTDPSSTDLRGAFRSYDTIGDIIVVKIPEHLEGASARIGRALLQANPKSRLVLRVSGVTLDETRVRPMKRIAGSGPTLTHHREFGATYVIDPTKVFFSPRLSHERWRVARQVEDGERVLNMFAGVGSFSILIALHRRARVYSVDKNPAAIEYMRQAIGQNQLRGEVIPLLGDARDVCRTMRSMDRVILPLPAISDEFLGPALETLGERGILHDYRKASGRRAECARTSERQLLELLSEAGPGWRVETRLSRPVRSVGRKKWHVVHDVLCSRPAALSGQKQI